MQIKQIKLEINKKRTLKQLETEER